MRILALETATDLCSVAMLQDMKAEVILSIRRPRAHSEHLVGLIDQALKLAACKLTDLDAVAVSGGPGSYTGLRIGTSTAKGLCYAAGLPLIGVPTLAAIASSVSFLMPAPCFIVTVLKSRRGEVYLAVFRADEDGGLQTVNEPEAVTLERHRVIGQSFPKDANILLTGDTNVPLSDLRWSGHPRTLVVPLDQTPFDAGWVARAGALMFVSGHQDNVAAFEPTYLKQFVARKPSSIFDRLPDMSRPRS